MITKTQPPGDPEFGAALTLARTAKHLSQRQLSELIEVDHAYVSRLEDGARTPSRDCARRLGDVLGVEVMIAAGYIPAGYRVVKSRKTGSVN